MNFILPSSKFLCSIVGLWKIWRRQYKKHIPHMGHYNPQLVYFLPTFWSPKTFFQGASFLSFWSYVWWLFKSNFKSRAVYSGTHTVFKIHWNIQCPNLASLIAADSRNLGTKIFARNSNRHYEAITLIPGFGNTYLTFAYLYFLGAVPNLGNRSIIDTLVLF